MTQRDQALVLDTAHHSILVSVYARVTTLLALTSALLYAPPASATSVAVEPATATPVAEAKPDRLARQPAPAPPPDDGRSLRVTGGMLMGLGAALTLPMALGITGVARARLDVERLNTIANNAERRFTPEEFAASENAYRHGKRMRAMAIATGITGGALFVSGLVVFLRGARALGDDVASPRRIVVIPALTPRDVGLTLTARF